MQRHNVAGLMAQMVTLQIAADTWRSLCRLPQTRRGCFDTVKSTSSKWSRRTSEKTSISQKKSNQARRDVKKRVRGPRDMFYAWEEGGREGTQGDQEMVMEFHETKEASSSAESGQ